MPQAKTALEHELSAFFDSATKITSFILSAPFPFVLLSDSFSLFSEAVKELGETELWFVALGGMLFKTTLFFVPLSSFVFS